MKRCLLLITSCVACIAACSDGSTEESNHALSASERGKAEDQPRMQPPAAEALAPRVVPGNPPSCASVIPGTDLVTFKIDPAKSGTYRSPDGRLTVTIVASEKTFSFTSSDAVGAVIVKGGPAANVYEFDPATTAGAALVAPRGAGLSHLDFCYPPPGGGGAGGAGAGGGSGDGTAGKVGNNGGRASLGGSGNGGTPTAGSGNGGTPTAGSGNGGPCPPNLQLWLSSEGASICTPIPIDGQCPNGYVLDIASEGQYCVPARPR